MIRPEARKSFAKVFTQFGIDDFDIERRGKNPHLVWEQNGRKHRIPISAGASDHRAHLNQISVLKRYIRSQNDVPDLRTIH